MPKLSKPVTVHVENTTYVIRGVDDWMAFATSPDRPGEWFHWVTECSPMWSYLPKAFFGKHGYPETAEGVLATAILEARAGIHPTQKYIGPEGARELSEIFGDDASLTNVNNDRAD